MEQKPVERYDGKIIERVRVSFRLIKLRVILYNRPVGKT